MAVVVVFAAVPAAVVVVVVVAAVVVYVVVVIDVVAVVDTVDPCHRSGPFWGYARPRNPPVSSRLGLLIGGN